MSKPSTLFVASLTILAIVSACGGSDDTPADNSKGNPGGSIVGSATSGVVNSSGGASGKSTTSTSGTIGTDLVDTTEETLDGRSYLLSKPKTLVADKKYPLVIMFHASGSTPKGMHDALPYDSASKDEAIIAYPAAGDGSEWNLNLPNDGNGDMDFVKALIDDLAANQPVDASKVLGFGYSGGAYFLSQYACRVKGPLKMVALLAGGAPEFHDGDTKRTPSDCVECPGGGIPMFIAHGQNDTESPFDGGDYARICWAEQNGCTNSSLKGIGGPCSQYNGCKNGDTTQWCSVPDQDHKPWTPSMGASWVMFRDLP